DARVPPDDAGAGALEGEPGRHVCLVIEIADDNLGTRRERLPDGQADRPDERRGVEAERDFAAAAGVHERRHALTGARDRRVDLARVAVRSTSLHVARQQVIGHRAEHGVRNLRAGGVVEEEKTAGSFERRKAPAHILDGKRLTHGRHDSYVDTRWTSDPETAGTKSRCTAVRPRRRSSPKSR